MAHTWKYAFGLGLVGVALSAGCTVTTGDDDASTGASAGESSGGSSGKGGAGGTSAKGGSSGSGGSSATGGTSATGGSSGTGGSGTGGSSANGGSSATGGSSGTGGSSASGGTGEVGGSGGSTSGSGGTGGVDTTPTCDPLEGTTPYDDCEPAAESADDPCAKCQQAKCCTEVKNCRSYNPYNVCAWGGPSADDPDLGAYAGAGEIGCIVTCLSEYVQTNEVCDADGIDMCTSMCQTSMCSVIGTSTSELFGCIQDNCSSECFGSDTCG